MDRTEPMVNWRRVGLYYGIAFGGAVAVAALIWLLRRSLGELGATMGVVATAVLYMPLPLVAGLIVERVARRRPLIVQEWGALRHRFWRSYGTNALVAVLTMLAIVVLSLLAAWAAGVLGLPGAGRLPVSDAEFAEHLAQLNPAMAEGAVPPLVVLVLLTLVQGILAGLTINGLFAFGEEYGWRGVLADLLRPLGLVRATLLTGVLWGLWHAPIIMLGHNYGDEWGWGIPVMVAWTVPLSFILTWTRERTGSVLAPAMLHGAFNGASGVFVLLLIGGNVLIALPVGLMMAFVLGLLALGVWRLPTGRQPRQVAGAAG
ncbi:MAG: CPBP family intramembrane metalloprotease [Propionibacteriaceae bacterium]|nr:CPBP family intramembrane metalloprotease [Propionibacteriaceae bacterium]